MNNDTVNTPRHHSTSQPFLSVVAKFYYKNRHDLADYCFVFPNRRSGQFFTNYLKMQSEATVVLPEITTIADFLSSITKMNPVSSVEALFILFSCYKDKNPDAEFDKFVYWGNMLLNDFNDVDMYMVDAKQLFTNVKEHREIATDYLDPELKKTLSEFFGHDYGQSYEPIDRFWKSDSTEGDNVKNRFAQLWKQLYDLYVSFTERLTEQNLSYTGMMYRHAVECISKMGAEEFPYKRYVFVGFNILSTSQIAIFKCLKEKKLAEFLWDFNSPAFAKEFCDNKGAKFISFYKRLFPQSSAFHEEPVTTFPAITVTGVPSNVGQVKYAISVVNKQIAGKNNDEKDRLLNDTAIVLPDENLFIPLVNTIGPDITSTNITLGYPLSSSSIVSLMHIVSAAHKHAYHDKSSGEWTFLRNDILNILSHPIVKAKFPKLSISLANKLKSGNHYKVGQSQLLSTDLELLFETVDDGKDGITSYISRLIQFAGSLKADAPATSDDEEVSPTLQEAFIDAYIDVLNELSLSLTRHDLSTQSLSTLFFLIDKLVGKHTVPFEGEPLKGLQIMGVLETRCLDFKNVIVLSMNDSVFPRKHFTSPSFISENMRRHFCMSCSEDQEAMPTYYFYRLISRADHVELIYNSSSTNAASSEWSRFITQLQKVYGCQLALQEASGKIKPADSVNIKISHGNLMNRYFDESVCCTSSDFAKSSLSASSINEYISCPLKFYFHHIQHLVDDNPESDFMDASTKGTIVHNTLQELYFPTAKNERVTLLDIFKFKDEKLDGILQREINKEFVKCKNPDEPLTGEAKIIFEPLRKYVLNAIDYDMNLLDSKASAFDATPKDKKTRDKYDGVYFEVLECEQTHNIHLQVKNKDGETIKFNFNYKPDRIDRINGTGIVRLIDYKTGGDDTSFSAIKDLFSTEKKSVKRPHAILQQFLYANAYLQEHGNVSEIQPMLYTMSGRHEFGIFCKGNDGNVKICRNNDDANQEFNNELYNLLQEMRSSDGSFTQAEQNGSVSNPCDYCNFIDFCRR